MNRFRRKKQLPCCCRCLQLNRLEKDGRIHLSLNDASFCQPKKAVGQEKFYLAKEYLVKGLVSVTIKF